MQWKGCGADAERGAENGDLWRFIPEYVNVPEEISNIEINDSFFFSVVALVDSHLPLPRTRCNRAEAFQCPR